MAATAPAPAQLDQLCVNTIRTLSMDAVQQANSGHPGTPMALAPLGHRLFTRHMKHDPKDPHWADRDRFVLSCGHASMLLYSLLHLSGYDVSLDDLRNFRQLHSPTAGHPERGEVPGVEFTTGPLGQGVASAVGMALAERMLAAHFNRPGHEVVDHRTWVIASDGDLMEGVSGESASLAGHLALDRLVVFWDDNRITIDGTTEITFTEDVAARYESYGWQVLRLDDVDDLEAIDAVVADAIADTARPTLVVTRTHIGIGSPRQDTPKAHGEPLGVENVRITKENYGWPADETFLVPDAVRTAYADVATRGADAGAAWDSTMTDYVAAHPELAEEYRRRMHGELPAGWADDLIAESFEDAKAAATRQSSGRALALLTPRLPELVGGSADLAASNNTDIADGGDVTATSYDARNLRYGIREHAMAAITNGIHAHGGLRAFGATFLIFSDYMRPAIRLSALMGLPSIWVFTHDSVFLGEDGPTHQPIEQLAALRAIPNLLVLRPAEANETLAAWKVAIEQTDRPVALALTRQGLEPFRYGDGSKLRGAEVERGGYVLRESTGDGAPAVILIATGSEVHLALAAAELLEGDGTPTRVVSMPSTELFLEQPREWRDFVLPPAVRARVTVEAATTFGWERFAGDFGATVGIDRFGLSAPGAQAAEALGITVDAVVDAAHRSLATVHGEG
ncbi:MAG: transketolase [Thermoleophilia bacterium]|nr:transketolase [Thermoleophilia bacterium]MCZ4496067.1 transketolase [Thermoleophilia bacterium]